MNEGSNRIVLAVVAALVILTIALVMGSGSCSKLGGSTGGDAMLNPSSNATSKDNTRSSQTNGEGVYDYSPVSGADKDMTIEEFEKLLASSSGQSGTNIRDAASSSNIPSGVKVYQELESRGFSESVVSADFDLNGNYESNNEIDLSSTDRFPSYTSSYVSSADVLWLVYINDGCYYAVALGSPTGELSKSIILTETDKIVQYDGVKNEFSDFALDQVPNTKCIKVDRIDKATLDSYTIDVLERA